MKKRKLEVFDHFKRQSKRLLKKYKSLTTDLKELRESLLEIPDQGINLGGGLYKIRLASASKGKGKSGGFRVVTYYIEQVGDEEIIYLVTIYDKSEEDNILKDDLLAIVNDAFGE